MTDAESIVLLCYLAATVATFGVMLSERRRDESLSGRLLLVYLLLAPCWPLVWLVSFVCWWRLK